jgi:16S rRNA G966 N2-methylase RsmD
MNEITKKTIASSITIGTQIPSQFRPSVAKIIYDVFNAKIVLDFSSGWGDRLAGFYCSNAKEYYGVDPNTRVYNTYKDQIELYSRLTEGKTSKIINKPAEDIDYDSLPEVDLVFTSPPYFDVERYSEQDTQSWIRYSNLESWKNDFLFNVLGKIWKKVKRGGYMIINISDISSYSQTNTRLHICDDMVNYMKRFDDFRYIKGMGMPLSFKPNQSTIMSKETTEEITKENAIFVEPMWVFGKDVNELNFKKKDYNVDDLFE